jgi:hypothetical protein
MPLTQNPPFEYVLRQLNPVHSTKIVFYLYNLKFDYSLSSVSHAPAFQAIFKSKFLTSFLLPPVLHSLLKLNYAHVPLPYFSVALMISAKFYIQIFNK